MRWRTGFILYSPGALSAKGVTGSIFQLLLPGLVGAFSMLGQRQFEMLLATMPRYASLEHCVLLVLRAGSGSTPLA